MCPAALQVELNKDRHSHGVGAASRVQAPSSPFCVSEIDPYLKTIAEQINITD